LRGFALSALFLVHMLESYELHWAHPDIEWASRIVFLLFMGKSFSLLAIGFGFSCYMLIDQPERSVGQDSLWFIWRLAILELIGFVHALIYRGDFIQVLAAVGVPLVLATGIRKNRILIGIAILCFLQPLRWWELAVAMRNASSAPLPPRSDPAMMVYLHGNLMDVLRTNMWTGQVAKWRFMFESGRITQILGLYLVGLVLGRVHFFSRLGELRRNRNMALAAGLAIVLLLQFTRPVLVTDFAHNGAGAGAADILNSILGSWGDLAVTACWGLMICALWQGPARSMLRPLANVGRATLTLYILQSLICVPLFYPFGASLYATWHGPSRLLAGLAGIGMQIWIAHIWFGRFRYGPMEWAWRCATARRWDIQFRRDPLRPSRDGRLRARG
jgi:uncharacterized protein